MVFQANLSHNIQIANQRQVQACLQSRRNQEVEGAILEKLCSIKWPHIVARPTRFSEHSAVSGMAGPPCLNAMLLKVYLNQKYIITLTSNAICTSNGFLCKL